MSRRYAFLFVLVFLCAADWPMFHGPDGLNRSYDTGLLKSWPEDGPPLLWKIDTLGEKTSGYSSLSFQGDRIYTAGGMDEKAYVFCLDMNGKILWKCETGPLWTKNYPGTRSTPTLDGDLLFDYSAFGVIRCIDSKSGLLKWSRDLLADFEGENIIWALAESPLLDGDKIICSPGGKKGSIVALNKHTGETLWASPYLEGNAAYGCGTFFEFQGRRFLAIMYAKGLAVISPKNGELHFKFEHTQRYDINCTRPIYRDGMLFICNPATPPNPMGALMLNLSFEGEKLTGKELWRNKNFDNLHDSVMLIGDRLYGTSHEYRGGMFMCVDWQTGETIYENRQSGRGSFTLAEGLLYFLSENRDVMLIRPNPDDFEVISRFKLSNDGEGPSWAHPVAHERKLYIRHGKYLYCYDISG